MIIQLADLDVKAANVQFREDFYSNLETLSIRQQWVVLTSNVKVLQSSSNHCNLCSIHATTSKV